MGETLIEDVSFLRKQEPRNKKNPGESRGLF